jgi:hypothetical protein
LTVGWSVVGNFEVGKQLRDSRGCGHASHLKARHEQREEKDPLRLNKEIASQEPRAQQAVPALLEACRSEQREMSPQGDAFVWRQPTIEGTGEHLNDTLFGRSNFVVIDDPTTT